MSSRYRDRIQAGRVLADQLLEYKHRPDVLVLALPRGGVPVAYEIAQRLQIPMDVFIVRKLGVPKHEELAMGAIAANGVRVINSDVVKSMHISESVIDHVSALETQELQRREKLYRGNRSFPSVRNRSVILVDDGLATGATMKAAVYALRQQQPASIVVAVPVAARVVYLEFQHIVDRIVCPMTPDMFYGVGWWYDNFSQTSDQEVRDLLARSAHKQNAIS